MKQTQKKYPVPSADTTLSLKMSFCSHTAAKTACEQWHYSKSIPPGKTVKVGVWEDDRFIGAVIFARGANKSIGRPYDLPQTEVCELCRVALRKHDTPVTKIVSIAIKMLKKACPGMRLIISYADLDQGHEGVIYRAGNWYYEGLKNKDTMGAFIVKGRKMHPKTIHSLYGTGTQRISWIKKNLDPNASIFITKGKHKYLYPLDEKMVKLCQRLHKGYPKKPSSQPH